MRSENGCRAFLQSLDHSFLHGSRSAAGVVVRVNGQTGAKFAVVFEFCSFLSSFFCLLFCRSKVKGQTTYWLFADPKAIISHVHRLFAFLIGGGFRRRHTHILLSSIVALNRPEHICHLSLIFSSM